MDSPKLLSLKPFEDHRGVFTKLFGFPELHQIIGSRTIRQVNMSLTRTPGMARGLHYQLPPFAEMKIVSCHRGKVWDVAVDLRKGSPTFLQWSSVELAAGDSKVFVIPEGFAHGFQALEPDSELLYFCTADYAPKSEAGVRYDSPPMDIHWPLPVCGLSDRDLAMPLIDAGFEGISL